MFIFSRSFMPVSCFSIVVGVLFNLYAKVKVRVRYNKIFPTFYI
jgi:hypothetical protein